MEALKILTPSTRKAPFTSWKSTPLHTLGSIPGAIFLWMQQQNLYYHYKQILIPLVCILLDPYAWVHVLVTCTGQNRSISPVGLVCCPTCRANSHTFMGVIAACFTATHPSRNPLTREDGAAIRESVEEERQSDSTSKTLQFLLWEGKAGLPVAMNENLWGGEGKVNNDKQKGRT